MLKNKVLTYVLLFFLISNLLVIMSPTNLAGVTGSIGSDIRSDGSYLYMTMEDGIKPIANSELECNVNIDTNSTLEGKYCLNISQDGTQNAYIYDYRYDNPIRPTKWSIKIKIDDIMTDSSTDIYPIKSNGGSIIHAVFYRTGALKIETTDFNDMVPWSFNTVYTVEFSNIDFTSHTCDATVKNATHSQTVTGFVFSSSVSSFAGFYIVGNDALTLNNFYLDDWTVGTQSNIDSDSATNIESTNTSFNGELINDGSPLQNASQSNHSVKILYGNYSINPIVDYGEQYTINNDAYETSGYGEPYYIGQSFTIGNIGQNISFSLQNISLNISRFGNPGNTTVRIRAINITNAIPAPDLVNVSINGDALSTDPEWVTFSFINPIILEKGTKYAIILNCTSAPPDYQNVIRWQCDMAGPASTYTGGNRMSGFNLSGEVDVTPSYWADDDYMFKLYGAYQYPFNSTFTELLSANTTNTDTFSKTIDGLTPGQIYYYRTYINTSYTNSSSYSYGDETYFLTKPEAPTNAEYILINKTSANISWTKGTGANNTCMVRKITGYPTSITDGELIYNNTGTYCILSGLTSGLSYYYRLWSYGNWSNPNLYQFSDNHTDIEFGALFLGCYNESNPIQNLSFSVKISNENGSQVYEAINCNTYHSINATLCPQGIITMQFSNSSYKDRIYVTTISSGLWLVFDAYLPPLETPAGTTPEENQTKLYLLTVINQNNQPVSNAFMSIKTYINTTSIYETIFSGYTDGNGQIDVYLIPTKPYKVFISATNYIDEIANYWPSQLIYTHTFMLNYVEIITPPPIIEPQAIIFTGEYLSSNNTIKITYLDNSDYTNWSIIEIWEYNYTTNTSTSLGTYNTTNQNWEYYITNINRTNCRYMINLTYSHRYFGVQYKVYVLEREYTPPTTPTEAENVFWWIGYIPFGAVNFFMWLFLIAGMYWTDSRDAGKTVMIIGVIFLFIQIFIGFFNILTIVAGGGTCILFIVIGILMEWNNSKKGEG